MARCVQPGGSSFQFPGGPETQREGNREIIGARQPVLIHCWDLAGWSFLPQSLWEILFSPTRPIHELPVGQQSGVITEDRPCAHG